MPRIFHTRQARLDLFEIWEHIASEDPHAADAVLDRIDECCTMLASHPALGLARDDIRPGLRYFAVSNYLILYRIIAQDIEIVRVVHGRRDLFHLI